MRLPVLRGALRGRWWLLESRGRILRVLFGSYEPEQTAVVLEEVGAGGTFLDVGAHAGYYTLLAARQVGPGGQVWAFEPQPRNAHFLREHVRINRLSNVRVEEVAVAGEEGIARFGGGSGSGTGRLTGSGDLEVRAVTLDGFCQRHAISPTAIKVDVEGAEGAVIAGGAETLRRHGPMLFLSTHGPEAHAESVRRLEALDYRVWPVNAGDVGSSSELICFPAHAAPSPASLARRSRNAQVRAETEEPHRGREQV